MSSLPLAGRRVLVTRAAHQAGRLSEGLRALGAEVLEVPVLEIRPPASFGPLDKALRQLDRYDWLILTSANTVRAVSERTAELGLRLETPAGLKVAAIGDATAAAARKAGFPVTLVPETYVAESLLKGLTRVVSGRRVLLAACAAVAMVARAAERPAIRDGVVDAERVTAGPRRRLPEGEPDHGRSAEMPRRTPDAGWVGATAARSMATSSR